MKDQYEPFGPEWEKEMMRHNKTSLISIIRDICTNPVTRELMSEKTKDGAKPEIAWAIWNKRVGVYYGTVTDRRACAVKDHMDKTGLSWKALRLHGDRPVQIKIEVLSDV